ncbi:MAG: PAS domain S-box protein [Limnothrix sp. CACIAM 69d]|nr:MAG: PAS domain S-box protein [Limnothrix sp. CACIAM 69d]
MKAIQFSSAKSFNFGEASHQNPEWDGEESEFGTSLKIGVLANRGLEIAESMWQPTADYLSAVVSGREFTMVPLSFDDIHQAIASQAVQFAIVNPGLYVEFETQFGLNRIATLKTLQLGKPATEFGGAIFSRRDRLPMTQLSDLKGRSVAAVAETSLGGWRMAWRELVEAAIDPYRDFAALEFLGSHDRVVAAVQSGQAEVGIVSTHVLEQLAATGALDLNTIQILPPPTIVPSALPFALSTRLYPEWPFAVLPMVPRAIAEAVTIALLQMPADAPAAQAAGAAGWTIPLNYQSVHECFQVLQVPPYRDFGRTTASFALAVKGSHDGLWDWMVETGRTLFSDRWAALLGYQPADIPPHVDQWFDRLHPDDHDRFTQALSQFFASDRTQWELEYRLRHRDGSYRWVLCRGTLQRNYQGRPYRMAGSHTDITNRKQVEDQLRTSKVHLQEKAQTLQATLQELQSTQLQLIQAEKMSSLGQLVAGIAHELNNPVSFIYGNMRYLEEYAAELVKIIQLLKKHQESPHLQEEILDQLDLDFIQTDLPKLITSMKTGTDRIRSLALSLRNFSRVDEAEMKAVDLHEGLESTLLILQHRLLPSLKGLEIQIDRQYGDLPLVECYPGQVNQVFMNLLSNAIDALESQFQSLAYGVSGREDSVKLVPKITIQTVVEDHEVVIKITDNGTGINPEVRSRIFDPFFTTKPIGQGTGLGLSIAYQIVVEQHHGRLSCQSAPGQGTGFEIRLPRRAGLTITSQLPAPELAEAL